MAADSNERTLQVVLPEALASAVREVAAESGLSVSAVLRSIVAERMQRAGRWVPEEPDVVLLARRSRARRPLVSDLDDPPDEC